MLILENHIVSISILSRFSTLCGVASLCMGLTLMGCAGAKASEDEAPMPEPTSETAKATEAEPMEEELAIVESPIAEDCYGKRDTPREIDTVVVHYASAIYWFDPSFQKIVSEEGKAYAEKIGLTKDNVDAHKYDPYLVKAIFEAYGVSSHYAIARDGTVIRFVPDNDRAYHAGRSTMPTDGREGVNDFSIGIELMASHPNDDPTVKTKEDAYTEAQYESLNKLIAQLCNDHGIDAVVGHDEIAPGRKTDPGPLFQWDRVRTEDYKPTACQ